MNGRKTNIDPDIELPDEDEDTTLPDAEPLDLSESSSLSLAAGRAAIERYLKTAPTAPGVYRMVDTNGEVLYVGKAKSIKKRITSYARPAGHDTRIERMIAATHHIEFVTTRTETEALLLEANLIKRLRPRFNVLMRDDKSFPYILITADHPAPQIVKHRGARNRPGDYYGPFASVWAVNRTITALQRAFLIRSCSDAVYESRTRPCLLHQIKRCSAPCTGEIKPEDYAELVREARGFLSGKSQAVKELLGKEMEKASETLDFERAAIYRDRLAALSTVSSQQGINPRGVEEADVFAIHQAGGFNCVQVFFFRTGQNQALNPQRTTEGEIVRYPGSPALVRAFLRRSDRLIACELEPTAAKALADNFHGDTRVKTIVIDGWTALSAYIPPRERRGLVLIDPPYEAPDEFARLAAALEGALRKWPTGIFFCWYPIKDMRGIASFFRDLKARGVTNLLRAELVLAPPSDEGKLRGTGQLIVNPPWMLDQELAILLPGLAKMLAPGVGDAVRLERFSPKG